MSLTNLPRRLMMASLLLVLTASPAVASPQGDPRDMVSDAYKEIAETAKSATDQEQLVNDLTRQMDERMDYQAFSARTLKGKWTKLGATQKQKFIKHFKKLVLRTYAKRFKPGSTFDVTYREETAWLSDERDLGEVRTTVSSKKAGADVDYLTAWNKKSKSWRIHDITVDEVSMSRNWRRQFVRVINDEGFDALIKRIRAKTEARK